MSVSIVGFVPGDFSYEGRIAYLSCNHRQIVPFASTTADYVEECSTCAELRRAPADRLEAKIRLSNNGYVWDLSSHEREIVRACPSRFVVRSSGAGHQWDRAFLVKEGSPS